MPQKKLIFQLQISNIPLGVSKGTPIYPSQHILTTLLEELTSCLLKYSYILGLKLDSTSTAIVSVPSLDNVLDLASRCLYLRGAKL